MENKQKTVADWLKKWLEYKSVHLKKRTYLRYKQLIELHITKSLGKYDIQELSLDTTQEFINNELQNGNMITNEGLAVSSIKTIVLILKSMLNYAIDCGAIPDMNKLARLQIPKLTQKLVDAYSIKDQMQIERYILEKGRNNHFGVILCLYTGLRLGELLSLKWEDIDLSSAFLHIKRTYSKIRDEKGKYTTLITTPKSESSQRVIPLPPFIIKLLKEKKKKSQSEYVFTTCNNTLINPRSYQRTFDYIIKCAKVPRKNFHALRHTFATRAMENGMDIKTLSEIMGHKSPVITLSYYGHSLLETKRKMMNSLSKISIYNQVQIQAKSI